MSDSRVILVSACLLGERCRWNGELLSPARRYTPPPGVDVIPICPEVDGELPVPREPAEIIDGDGEAVLDGAARVVTRGGRDVTDAFLRGAEIACARARASGASRAILAPRSPSCGTAKIPDGTFSGEKRTGRGVTAAALRRAKIDVGPPPV